MDALILGAGAAGLAAAGELARRGADYRILEARGRTGGRVHTIRECGFSLPLELGAEFIHGKAPITFRLLRAEGLAYDEVPDDHLFRTGRGFARDGLWEEIEALLGGLKASVRDRSFDEFLAAARARPAVKERARAFVAGFHAADPARIGERELAKGLSLSRRREENRAFRLRDGFERLLRSLWRGPESRLRLGDPVVSVRWATGRVVALTASGERHSAKTLLVTLPLGVLKSPPGQPGHVRFEPGLGMKSECLSLLEMGSARKVLVRLREGPGRDPLPDGASFIHAPGAPFPVWWTPSPRRAGLVTAWAGGPRERLEGREAEESARRCLAELLPDAAERAERFLSHDWQADPYARGAYSYAAVGGAGARRELARPVQGTLFFAGEATDAAGQHATVEGAIASGLRAARELLRSRAPASSR